MTLIDPRYKELPFLDANKRKSLTEEVEDERLALEIKVSDDLMEVNEWNSEDLDQHSNELTEPATKKEKKTSTEVDWGIISSTFSTHTSFVSTF